MTLHPLHARSANARGPYRVGWKQASTITGFCSAHDGPVFGPLETRDYLGTEEQCFLHTYRAICREIYSKTGALRVTPIMREHSDKGFPSDAQRQIQRNIHWHEEGLRRGLTDQMRFKRALDSALVSGDRSPIETASIEFKGAASIATCGAFSPDIDLKGNRLQVIHDDKTIEGLAFSSDVTPDGIVVVAGWLRGDRAPLAFMDTLLGLPAPEIASTLAQLLFLYLENTYFSSVWWNQLPPHLQTVVRGQVSNVNPYYSEKFVVRDNIAGWQLNAVRRH